MTQTLVDFSDSFLYDSDPIIVEGSEYIWICMDSESEIPEEADIPFFFSTEPSSLNFGRLTALDSSQLHSITDALLNAYLYHQNAVLTDVGYASTAYDFQAVAWHLVNGAIDGKWSGVLDANDIQNLITDPGYATLRGGNITSGFESLFMSSLTPHPEASEWDILFGVPATEEYVNIQPIMLLSNTPVSIVPEPTSLLLIGATGSLLFIRRKRSISS